MYDHDQAAVLNCSTYELFILVFRIILEYKNWVVNTCNITLHAGTSDIL